MTHHALPRVVIRTPDELLDAIPFLLGFQPRESLVLVGFTGSDNLVARMDLPSELPRLVEPLSMMIAAFVRRSISSAVAVVFSEDMPEPDPRQRWGELIEAVGCSLLGLGIPLTEVLLASDTRWWSALCGDSNCCPVGGTLRTRDTAAKCGLIHQGLAPQPSREDLLAPMTLDKVAAQGMRPLLEAAEQRLQAARETQPHRDALLRRDRDALLSWILRPRGAERLAAREVARFAVALREPLVRDAAWMLIDRQAVDVAFLLEDMATRLPGRYRAAPLFLWGWRHWRANSAIVAAEAARSALDADPEYSAASLLVRAVNLAVRPDQMPTFAEMAQR